MASNSSSNNREVGFILTRQWRETSVGQDLHFWISAVAGPVKIIVNDQESVFFVAVESLREVTRLLRMNPTWRHDVRDLTNFDGLQVAACYFTSQANLVNARSKLRGKIRVYEADIKPSDRFLMERFITAGVEVRGILSDENNYVTFRDAQLRPALYKPKFKLVSLDIETSYTENILYSIAVQTEQEEKVFMVGEGTSDLDYLEYYSDETALILKFLDWIELYDPDLIIGWNVVGFDLTFLQSRCDELLIEFRLGRGREKVYWRSSMQRNAAGNFTGNEKQFALVPGRVVLDGIELLRTASYQFESFSLENVARELLGRGKLIDDVDDKAAEIRDLFKRDKEALAKYNLEDCVLVTEIFERTNLVNFAIERSHLTGLDLDRAGGSVAAFDYLYLPRLHRQGMIAPSSDDKVGAASPGGFVLNSKPGIYDHVIVLDFKSLYPSIIRTFNVDPLAMAAGREEDDAIEGFGGANFSRHKVILPEIIQSLWEARDQAKLNQEAALSQAIKIIMNSFYGVLGTSGCRFFDTRLVSSITLRGHEILQKTRDILEERGLNVIYGDTDSVFVLLKDVKDKEEADEVGLSESAFLNQWWRNYLARQYQIESCLEVEYETYFSRFLMPTVRGSEIGSKKRYAGMVPKGDGFEMVYKGLEAVRSDWSPLARDFQRELYEKIFNNEPYEQLVKDRVREVLEGRWDDHLVLRKRIRRNLADYQKNVPPHVKAARIEESERQKRGVDTSLNQKSWIEYVMTVNGAEPKRYMKGELDYQFYIDKQLAPIADAILSFKSTSLAQITDLQLGLF